MDGKYEGLWNSFMASKLLGEPIGNCVDWAAKALDEGSGDEGLRQLAALAGEDPEAIEESVGQLLGMASAETELWAGRHIARMAQGYFEGRREPRDVDAELSRLYSGLGSPDWLSTLKRDCEFSADLPEYREPFEAELKYLSRLWSHARDLADFMHAYDCRISGKHDLR